MAHTPVKQRAAVAAMLKAIFVQQTKAEAETHWAVVADALCDKQPKLATMMDASCGDVMA
jgi:putative transposase